MRRVGLFSSVACLLMTAGCGLNYFQVDDPTKIMGLGPSVSEVVKALRCEITTFLAQNRLRQKLFDKTVEKLGIAISDIKKNPNFYKKVSIVTDADARKLKGLANISIDARQYASIVASFKNVHTANFAIGLDVKSPVSKTGEHHVNRFGPAYADTRTFDLFQQLNIRQDADLGPNVTVLEKPNKAFASLVDETTTVYNPQIFQKIDRDFYCYHSLAHIGERNIKRHGADALKLLGNAVRDVQSLLVSDDDWKQYENFTRIYVGLGGTTLAKWLQEVATETTLNERTITPVSARAILGQLQYQFVFDVKPSFNLKYTLVAIPINPFVADFTGTLQHSGTFTLFLNTPTGYAAYQAKSANACYKKDQEEGTCREGVAGASERTLQKILETLEKPR